MKSGALLSVVVLAVLGCSALASAVNGTARTLTVCASGSAARGCEFRGDAAIQTAVDMARSGDRIVIAAGRYMPVSRRDIPYKEFVVRGYVVIDGKDLTIEGEPGALLDGSTQLAAAAIVVRNAAVTLRNLEIAGFRYEVEEDDVYDGHGIFVIDGRVTIEDVTIRNFKKMGLTARGDSLLDAVRVRILDGHVGIWLHETAHLRLRDSVVRGNDSAAIAAYENSTAHASGSTFDGNLDDGLYADERATLYVRHCRILRNKPFGAHAVAQSRIFIESSELNGNEKPTAAEGSGQVTLLP